MPGRDEDLVERYGPLEDKVYRQHFAPFLYTYVRGLRELLDLLLIEPHFDTRETVIEFVKAARMCVVPTLPEQWPKTLVKNTRWTELCQPALIALICEGKAARLDRCCHAILAVQFLFKTFTQNSVLRDVNVYDFITLAPAMFTLPIRDNRRAQAFLHNDIKSAQKRVTGLITELAPKDGADPAERAAAGRKFLADAAKGHAMTYENARVILAELWKDVRPVPPPPPTQLRYRMEVPRRPKRSEKTSKKYGESALRCCDEESSFIKLGEEKLAKLLVVREKAERYASR